MTPGAVRVRIASARTLTGLRDAQALPLSGQVCAESDMLTCPSRTS